MENPERAERIKAIRVVLGSELSDMDIIRALHLAKNDINQAINIIFDTPSFQNRDKFNIKRTTPGGGARVSITANHVSSSNLMELTMGSPSMTKEIVPYGHGQSTSGNEARVPLSLKQAPVTALVPIKESQLTAKDKFNAIEVIGDAESDDSATSPPALESNTLKEVSCSFDDKGGGGFQTHEIEDEWWFVGCTEVIGFSTCKGRRLNRGDAVTFSFPIPRSAVKKRWGGGRAAAACSEIVRFSTKQYGEVGRLPAEWTRYLIPLVNLKKVKIQGCCVAAPETLGLMDSILLAVRLYINNSIFQNSTGLPLKLVASSTDDSTINPLPMLLRLLGKKPFQKADFTPEDLYTRKRSLDLKDNLGVSMPLLPSLKRRKPTTGSNEQENEGEEDLSDSELDKLVGASESCHLEEMDPPSTLLCDLRPYQKQALCWMSKLEKGTEMEKAAKTLHPCWNAYRIADKRATAVYVNAFSGEATAEFPSALQITRGGILADAMGLGKTVMTISLILANPGKGGYEVKGDKDELALDPCMKSVIKSNQELNENERKLDIQKSTNALHKGGGTLIVCPMTLLGQWKAEIEAHAQSGSVSIYVHYGSNRLRDVKALLGHDVVLTTYGVLSSSFHSENPHEESVLHAIHWFRVVLDEAHSIKSSKSQMSQAVFALVADCRWCLTGTPIQNKLEDVYSLFHFLRVEPWGNWGWWYKLIQKPFEEGDERGLKLVQAILRPLMLRRTKDSTDKEGRPILVLPPTDVQVIECEFTEAENDFYTALYKRSKVQFDRFVEQGKVLHNYASILELLLRLRQCCDHPFLVMSRGDTQQYSDMNKLARRFLLGSQMSVNGDSSSAPSKAYVEEVVKEIRNGERGECPICLESVDDAVLTPCAHHMCRECLLASWRSSLGGSCPVCRKTISKQDLITCPTGSRFRVDVEKNWTESSKVLALLKHLQELKASGLKGVVFSQWTSFLDLLQIPLRRVKYEFVRLDGTLSQQQRENVINEFRQNPDVLVMLISLKAGGVGINLTAASHVFIMDPWWNPAVEEQAIMRIHRIGQTKKVTIRRFIVKGTVEERMQQVQARKQRIVAGALTDGEVRSARIEELKMLFR